MEGKHQRLLKLCNDQEKALEEVGVRLRDTKLEADTLKYGIDLFIFVFVFYTRVFTRREATVWAPRDAQWAPDEQVTHCGLCNKEFNLARRKVSS